MARERAETCVQPVDGLAAGQHAVDHVTRGAHVDQRPVVQGDARATTSDGEESVHAEPVT